MMFRVQVSVYYKRLGFAVNKNKISKAILVGVMHDFSETFVLVKMCISVNFSKFGMDVPG
jgi:hypothetical protein